MKEPEYPSLYDPRSGTGEYYPWEEEYKEKMKIYYEICRSEGRSY